MSDPKISLASQLSALERAIGRLNGTSNNALTPGQSMLEQRDLNAALESLLWLDSNRDWIVEAAKSRKDSAE